MWLEPAESHVPGGSPPTWGPGLPVLCSLILAWFEKPAVTRLRATTGHIIILRSIFQFQVSPKVLHLVSAKDTTGLQKHMFHFQELETDTALPWGL